MTNTLGPRARSQEYVLRRKGYGQPRVCIDCDFVISSDCRCLDLQIAVSIMLIPGLIVVASVITPSILTNVAIHSDGSTSSWPVPLQKSPRCRWNPVFTLLVLHALVIHWVNSGFLRACGTVAYGAATGRTKSSEDLSF